MSFQREIPRGQNQLPPAQKDPDKFLAAVRGLSNEHLAAMKDFDREKTAQGMAQGTRYMYAYSLSKLGRFIKKPFQSATKADLIDFLKEYSWYKSRSLKVSVKAFYKWLNNDKGYPESVSWIKTHGYERRKLPEELLTKEDVKALVEAAQNPRDRALIFMLYESGARAGEILGIRIKHVNFDKYGAQVMLDGKTGMRRIRLIDCIPDLKLWLNHHPRAADPDAPLFIEFRSSGFMGNHATLLHIIRAAKERAGIKKRIYPHLFRHTRATHLASDFTEQELKVIFGWTGGSKMPATYVHLSGADVDNKMLEKRGMIEKEDKQEQGILEFKACPNCKEKNTAVAKYCNICGLPMGNKEIMQVEMKKLDAENLMNVLMTDDIARNTLVERMIVVGLGKKLA